MLYKLWQKVFPPRRRPVTRVNLTDMRYARYLTLPEPSQVEEAELVINALHHDRAVMMWKPDEFKNSPYMGPIAKARLTPDAREWCNINTPGFAEHDYPAANIIMRVTFANDVHAALFKLMWL